MHIETVPVGRLHEVFGWQEPAQLPAEWRDVPLVQWRIDADAHILRYVFRHLRPRRHLEFGTLLVDGVIRCVEECEATFWTVNLLNGETKDDKWAYAHKEPNESAPGWAE